MSRGRHLAGFAFAVRRWLIASATIASVFLATSVGTASANTRNWCATRVAAVGGGGSKDIGKAPEPTEKLTLIHESHWPTDSWTERPGRVIRHIGQWRSESGYYRGCHNEAKYRVECTGLCWEPLFDEGTVAFSLTVSWRGSVESSHCTIVKHDTRPYHLNGACVKTAVHELGRGNFYVVWTLRLCTSYINIPEPGVPPPPSIFPPGVEICFA
jgi:hypothetical protein